MAQLNVKLSEEQIEALRKYAARRRTPVSWLIKDYIEFLLAGGKPVSPAWGEAPEVEQVARAAERGGSFDWLREEPEIYSEKDGEAV